MAPTDPTSEQQLWNFALAVYGGPGVSQALVKWQDEAGADICLLLALLFAEHTGKQLDAATVRRLDEQMAPWRNNVVHPLRQLRRDLKPLADGDSLVENVRDTVKAAELSAERRQLAMLADAIAPLSLGTPALGTALTLYAAHLGVPTPELPDLQAGLAAPTTQ